MTMAHGKAIDTDDRRKDRCVGPLFRLCARCSM